MKRFSFTSCLILAIITIVFGFAYSDNVSKNPNEKKLVGMGPYGQMDGPSFFEIDYAQHNTVFPFHNPNTTDTIIITGVRIFDQDGNKVYDGPYPKDAPIGSRFKLEPHAKRIVNLNDWLDGEITNPVQIYSVEIIWSAKGNVLPPYGAVILFQKTLINGDIEITKSTAAMRDSNKK